MNLIDFHCDTAEQIYRNQASLMENTYHIDIQRLKQAGYTAQWFAFFVNLNDLTKESPLAEFQAMHTYFLEQVKKFEEHIEIVTNYDQYKNCKEQHKIAAFLSIEEGQILEGNLDNLDLLRDKGVRLMTLTWNFANSLGYPHSSQEGLTLLGKETISRVNELPILLDISHLSEGALKDIRALYKKPIIASHSNARGFYNHTRNVTDQAIKQIAESGGIIGTNFYSYFLNNSNQTTIERIIANIQYVYKYGGSDVLAFGTDFDGINCDLEVCTCKEMDTLISRLFKNFPSHVVEKLCYGNAERIIKENL